MDVTSTRNVVVEAGGHGVVGHVGSHALGAFADRLGVGGILSGAVGWSGPGRPVHDRERVLTQAMLMLAGGGESGSEIEALASQDRLFGQVCSDTTLYRTFTRSLDADTVRQARKAIAAVRARVWDRVPALTDGRPVLLDVDASLVEIHSERKQGAATHFNGGFVFHPLFCFADATGEALGGRLRAGNAAANNTADLLGVVDDAVGRLPAAIAVGHRSGDDSSLVEHRLVVRSDSAGGTHWFVGGLRDRNIGFEVVARRQTAVSAAITLANTDHGRWETAISQDGDQAEPTSSGLRTEVCEVTDLVDLGGRPEGTRLIIRRQPLHPGAQSTLLPDLEYRFWGHYTDQDGDPVELDRQMRAHARVEDHIGRLRDSGLERFPFTSLEANRAWLQTVMRAADLVAWFQLLCLVGPLARSWPKRLCWTLWHAPARIIRTARSDIILVLDGWPTAPDILAACRNIAASC